MQTRKLKMALVGGGEGAFIGAIHRMAAAMDGNIELVAGAFSRDAEKSLRSGLEYCLAEDRIYSSYEALVAREAKLPETERIDFIAIVTPNHLHIPIAKLAMENGFHVLCDKPLASTLEDAKSLRHIAHQADRLFGITQTYAAYPMVEQARELVQSGTLGELRRISVSYPQGWLARQKDTKESKQAAWRTDPRFSGESGCFADIGIHAHNLAERISGLRVTEVCADIRACVPGRVLDDDGAVLFRMDNDVRGTLVASQACGGEVNNLSISVCGELASLHWQQDDANTLLLNRVGKTSEKWVAGVNNAYLSNRVRELCRTPAGHPEGYIEAFANIYSDFAHAIRMFENKKEDSSILAAGCVTDLEAGIRGMAFVRASISSSLEGASWTKLKNLID